VGVEKSVPLVCGLTPLVIAAAHRGFLSLIVWSVPVPPLPSLTPVHCAISWIVRMTYEVTLYASYWSDCGISREMLRVKKCTRKPAVGVAAIRGHSEQCKEGEGDLVRAYPHSCET
jgi:hypothetical protein